MTEFISRDVATVGAVIMFLAGLAFGLVLGIDHERARRKTRIRRSNLRVQEELSGADLDRARRITGES